MSDQEKKILQLAQKNAVVTSGNVAELFDISRQAAHKKLEKMIRNGLLIKIRKTRGAKYVLPGRVDDLAPEIQMTIQNNGVKEHEVLEDIFAQFPQLRQLPENIQSIFRYAFSEMLNNAIEHSSSNRIEISVGIVDGLLNFSIRDFGIGVFNKVRKAFKLDSAPAAIAELLKGKTTTTPKNHTGEGIFFTSKVADTFRLESFGYALLVANTIPDVFIKAVSPVIKGTDVIFTISTTSKKHLLDVFEQYTAEDDGHSFDKTTILVKLFAYGPVHVSRSQARRILARIPDRFSEVVLDFKDIPNVGQAFGDEVFRVFADAHPEVKIKEVNANEAVQFMIDRAKKK